MSCETFFKINPQTDRLHKEYLCDTEGDLPNTGLTSGETAIVKDNQKIFITDSAVWIEKVSATWPLLAPDSLATAPRYSFTNNTGTGMYRDGTTGQLGFSHNGVARLRFDNDVIYLQPGENVDILTLTDHPSLLINQQGTGNILELQDDGVSVFVVRNDGALGIGINNPSARLDVRLSEPSYALRFGTDISHYGFLSAGGVDDEVGLMGWQNDAIAIREGDRYYYGFNINTGDRVIAINAQTGNVSVGGSEPNSKLEIISSITHTYPTPGGTFGSLTLTPNGTNDQSASITFRANNAGALTAGAQAGIYVQSSAVYGTRMSFGTTNNYAIGSQIRMIIAPDGKIGFGTIEPGQRISIVENVNHNPPGLGNSGGIFGIFKDDGFAGGNYGLMSGVQSTGNVWMQVQRRDGTATAYNLLLQPSGGNVGIGGEINPNVSCDVNGGLALRVRAMILGSGQNHNIAIGNRSFIRITGPTSAFTLTGFANGYDGKLLVVYNATNYNMTIANENANSFAANRIWTLTGGNVALSGTSSATFIYSSTDSRWIFIGERF